MEIAIIPATLAVTSPTNRAFSSLRHLSGSDQLRFSTLSFNSPLREPRSLTIRMGGGPRTFPGGVSKWQWKRMQAKKANQLLKARLCRERQLYEMRKRAELKAAVAELEKPWEVVERAPTLFSVKADEQVKSLADRFQKPGGFDMWTEKDGPQVFRTPDGLPSARFFPKGVVHSVRPYGIGDGEGEMRFDDWIARGGGGGGYRRSSRRSSDRHGREGAEVLEVGSDEGIVHTRCLMNVQKDGGSGIRDVNYGHEEHGGEVGIDGLNGSNRSMRRSPSRRRNGEDGLEETEYVVAEFEVSRNSEDDGGGNVDSSFKSRNWGFPKMEEGNAMEGEHGSWMDEPGSSRYSRDLKIENGNDAMGGRRRYGSRGPYGSGRSSDQRSYASDPETMGVDRADGLRMDEQRNARGSYYGRGQRTHQRSYSSQKNQRSYASDRETMGEDRAEGSRMDEQRNARGSYYGRGQRTNQRSYSSQKNQRSYAYDPETMGVNRADGSRMYEQRNAGGSYYGRGQRTKQRSSYDPETMGENRADGSRMDEQRNARGSYYGRGQRTNQRSYSSQNSQRSYAYDPETMGVNRTDGSRMDEQRNARGSYYGRGQRTNQRSYSSQKNQRSYASDSETMGSQQGRHVGGPPYGRTYASYSEAMANGIGRDDGRNRWGIKSKRVSIRPSTNTLYDGDDV